jgi:hypothetical protein
MTTKTDRRAELERFDVPLYTLVEAAPYLDVPPSTLTNWAKAIAASRWTGHR